MIHLSGFRFFLGIGGFTLALAIPGEARKPNIIFILADDLGYGDLGVLWQAKREGTPLRTPELDRMAAEGMVLDRHYTSAPVCAPARASLLSGMHQGHANVRDNQFDKAVEDNLNMANSLRAAGYYTALVGKYGLQGAGSSPAEWQAYPTERGFDYFYGYVRHGDGHMHYPANDWPLGNSPAHRTPKELWENGMEVSKDLDRSFTQDLFTAKAKQMIRKRAEENPDQPFLLFLAYDTPHGALQLPTMAYPPGKGIGGGLQWLGTPGRMVNTAGGVMDSYRDPAYTGKSLGDVHERYATVVTRLDRSIGDLLQTLRDLGMAEKTLVIITSDNGPHQESYIRGMDFAPQFFQSYGPFEGEKRDVFEGGIRMPTLAWGPSRVPAGRVSGHPCQIQDWMATFLDFAGMERPARIDGVSLLPTLTGKGNQREGIVYVEYSVTGTMPRRPDYPNHGGASRNQAQVVFLDGYKGVRNDIASHADDFAIFDVRTDPKESRNLAGTSAYFAALQQRMKDRVVQVRMPDSSAPRPYDEEPVPGIPVASPVNGILTSRFEGSWNWMPDFATMASSRAGLEPSLSASHLPRKSNAGLFYTGFISIPAAGAWTFYATSDKGVLLKLHDKLVLDADYQHDGSEVRRTVKLGKGMHPFRLYYRTGTGGNPALALKWSGPGIPKADIPPASFFVDRTSTAIATRPLPSGAGAKGIPEPGRGVDGRLRPPGASKKGEVIKWKGETLRLSL